MKDIQNMKMTSLGLIPHDWEVYKLLDVCDFPTQGISSSDFDHRNYISTDNMLQDCQGVIPYTGSVNYQSVREYQINDILLSNIRPYLRKIWLADVHAGCSSDVIVVRTKLGYNPKYIYSLLSNPAFFQYVMEAAVGTKMPRGDKKRIKEYSIALPSDAKEQIKISEALSSIDSLILALGVAIAKKRQIKDGLMQQLLTGKTRLHGFSGEWVDIQLSQIGDMFAGGTPSTFNKEYWDGDICWLHSGAVQNCFVYPSNVQRKITSLGLQHSAARLIKADSVIVAITGATCANIGYLTFVSAANQSVVAIEPTAAYDSKFLYYKLLKSREQILSHKGGSAQSGVSLRSLSSVRIFIPADKKEQKAISDILLSIDAEIISLESKRDKYALIKQGMMQELLTGTIRLI